MYPHAVYLWKKGRKYLSGNLFYLKSKRLFPVNVPLSHYWPVDCSTYYYDGFISSLRGV